MDLVCADLDIKELTGIVMVIALVVAIRFARIVDRGMMRMSQKWRRKMKRIRQAMIPTGARYLIHGEGQTTMTTMITLRRKIN
jgi:hypothetical protein